MKQICMGVIDGLRVVEYIKKKYAGVVGPRIYKM